MPKPEEDLDSESAEKHSDLPEQSSESSGDDSSSETSVSSCESYNVDDDEGSEELSSEEETETASTAERAPSTPDKVSSNQTVILGEGISQINESSYQTALASTSSTGPDDVANTVDNMIILKTTCNNMSTLIVPENGDSTQSISGRSRLLSLKVNTKRRNVVLTVLPKISKMRQWSSNYITICNHSIKESSASITLGE